MDRAIKLDEVLKKLSNLANPKNVAQMEHFGSKPEKALGISVPALRKLAKEVGKHHQLAQQLWETGIHEARHLAALIEEPEKVTEPQIETWAAAFDSWDICDGCCNNLFRKTSFAHSKAVEWSSRQEQYVKRAGFVLMAVLAVHDIKAEDTVFLDYLHIIHREAADERNFVKKAVNWALRQIGKRNLYLNNAAVQAAHAIKDLDSASARWIASDALRELMSEKIQHRIKIRK